MLYESQIFVIRLAFMKMVQTILEKPKKNIVPVNLQCTRLQYKEWIVTDDYSDIVGNGASALAAINDYKGKITDFKVKNDYVPLSMDLVREGEIKKMSVRKGKEGVNY